MHCELGHVKLVQLQPSGLIIASDDTPTGYFYDHSRLVEADELTIPPWAGITTKLAYVEVDAGEADVYGGEPVFSDQKVVGVTTPGACGHAVQKSLALAHVNPEFVEPGSAFDKENLGVRCRAKILAEPAYKSRNKRLRS